MGLLDRPRAAALAARAGWVTGGAPDQRGRVPTHVPLVTMDNRQMMELHRKDLGSAPMGSMLGGGWQSSLSSLYRTGPSRLRSLASSYGGTNDSVSWVFSCTSLVASTLASYPWRFEDDANETVEKPPDDLVALLHRPNPAWTYFDLMEALATDLELVGNGYVLKDQMSSAGKPKALYRLRPDMMRIATRPDGQIYGYVYTPQQGLAIPYDAEEIIHLRYPNPLDDYYGMGTVEALASVLDQISSQNLHITGFFQNGARISGVLTVPNSMTDTQFERLKASYLENYAGPANAYKLLIAEGGGDYKPIVEGPAAAGVVDLSKLAKDEVLAGFGVPAPLLGGTMENANYKMEESQHIFTRAMIPRTRRVSERLTVSLIYPIWKIHLRIDAHANEPLEVRLEHGAKALQAGAKANEAREMAGLPLSDDPMADRILIPNNLIPLSIVGEPPRPGRSIPLGEQGEPGAPKPDGTTNGSGSAGSSLADRLAELPEQVQAPKGDLAAEIKAAVEERFSAIEDLIRGSARAEATKAESGAEGAPGPTSGGGVAAPPRPAPRSKARSARSASAETLSAWGGPRRKDWEPPELPRGFEAPSAKAAESPAARAIREHQARALRVGVDTFEPVFRRYFKAERDRVLGALSDFGSGQRSARLRAEARKAKDDLDAAAIFDLVAENEVLVAAYLPALDEVGKVAVQTPPSLGGGISWDLSNPRITGLRDKMARLVTRVNETTRSAIADVVSEGMRRGYSIPQIANGYAEEKYGGVMGVFDDATDVRAETIARTESANAFGWATALSYRDAGTESVEILDGTGDEVCAEADGSVWTIEEYEANPTGHPNAVFAGTRILPLGEVERGYAAEWRGPAVLLTTAASTGVLAVTPNHPVLTGRGWVRAGEVQEGDDVVRCRGSVAVAVRPMDPDVDNEPALVEEMLDALRRSGLTVAAIPSGADLHGDGRFIQGEVDVVVPDSPLSHVPYAALIEENRELVLAGTGVKHQSFARQGALLLRSDRVPLAAAAGIPSLLGATAGDASLSQALSDEVRADAELLGDLRDGFALAVELDRVVGVGFDADRCGHVFDLQTAGRAYFADGILLSNCSRAAVPSEASPGDNSDGGEGEE